jgi:hypothetical protein
LKSPGTPKTYSTPICCRRMKRKLPMVIFIVGSPLH